MDERIFNLFIYFDGGKAHEVGAWFHKKPGTDNEKTDFLRSQVDGDYLKARRFDLPRSFTPEQWRAQLRLDGPESAESYAKAVWSSFGPPVFTGEKDVRPPEG